MPDENESTIAHYDRLLARIYTWTIGGIEAAKERTRDIFQRCGVEGPNSRAGRLVLDVGAGSGPQSLVLGELGYDVTALDPNEALLAEAQRHAQKMGLAVTTAIDAVPLNDRHPGPFSVITCMTDTLTSLPNVETAKRFIDEASRRLEPDGALVLTWRDLTRLPEGDDRFLAVRSDPARIATCFLEAIDEDRVRVTDLYHERTEDRFEQLVSSYAKLRLGPAKIDAWLSDCGLSVHVRDEIRGMHVRVARQRPPVKL